MITTTFGASQAVLYGYLEELSVRMLCSQRFDLGPFQVLKGSKECHIGLTWFDVMRLHCVNASIHAPVIGFLGQPCHSLLLQAGSQI